jgi:signal transduction histidine kinase
VSGARSLAAESGSSRKGRDEVARLADEQAALRRVATLAASGIGPEPVFRAVADELQALFGTEIAAVLKFEGDGTVSVKGDRGGPHAAGARVQLDPDYVVAAVAKTGCAARFDTDDPGAEGTPAFARELGIRSGVASPILVDGELWGAMTVTSRDSSLPPDTERRLVDFTELVATAVSSAQAQADVERLAEEQAALRRVATLVARGAPPEELFAAVTEEAAQLLPVDFAGLGRYEEDTLLSLAIWGKAAGPLFDPGKRFTLGGENVTSMVARTGRPARIDRYGEDSADVSVAVRATGIRSTVGTPIIVDGQLWGVMLAGTTVDQPLAEDTEARLAAFTELLVMAIANAESHAELAASRSRIVAAADESRRRIARDLHDGAQQRLVHSIITLKLALRALGETDDETKSLVDEALEQAEQANVELRELAHGILPSVLTRGGLQAGVETVVSRLDVPVHVDITNERFPAEIEASAYFIIAEALTNVVKHAHATRAEVKARVEKGALVFEVRDDGVGGADAAGHGLVGLADRATALGGWLQVQRLPSGGTLVAAALPLPAADDAESFSEGPVRPPAATRP